MEMWDDDLGHSIQRMRAFTRSYAEMTARLDVVAAGRDVGGRGLFAPSLPAASAAPASVAGLEEAP